MRSPAKAPRFCPITTRWSPRLPRDCTWLITWCSPMVSTTGFWPSRWRPFGTVPPATPTKPSSSCPPSTCMRRAPTRAMVADGLLGPIRVVQVEYAQDWLATPLEETGSKQAGLAHRSRALRRRRLDRRHRHPRLQPRELRHRAEARVAGGRPAVVRARPAARRQRPRAAALRRRRARHALVQPGRGRQRERAAPPRLRREGRARMGAGGPELPLVHAARRAEAAADPRRRRRATRGGAGQPHAGRPSRGLSRGLRQHLRRGRAGDPGAARRHQPVPKDVVYPTIEDGVAGVAFVEACVRSSARNGAWVSP